MDHRLAVAEISLEMDNMSKEFFVAIGVEDSLLVTLFSLNYCLFHLFSKTVLASVVFDCESKLW